MKESAVARPRFYAVAFGIFAAVAGILAVIGIYGVLAYVVAQRTREFGIRIALGAQRSDVLALVLYRGAALAATGIAAGLAGAAAASRLPIDQRGRPVRLRHSLAQATRPAPRRSLCAALVPFAA